MVFIHDICFGLFFLFLGDNNLRRRLGLKLMEYLLTKDTRQWEM